MQEDTLFVWRDILVEGYFSESGRKTVTPEEARRHRDLAVVTRFWNDNRLEPISYEDYEAEINGENSSERRYDPEHNWYTFDGGYEWLSLPRDFTLPEEIIAVGPSAFQLSEFRSVTIPEGAAILGDSAFFHCRSLEEVRLPSTLREIGSWCFGKCEKLRSIVMPEQIECYGIRPFHDCPSLADEQGFIIFNKRLFEYFPREENETCTVIPEGVERIMAYAFGHLTSLRTLVLPESLREVEDGAFKECSGLADENGFVIVKNKLLYYCGDSPVLHLPETVRCIGSESFFGRDFSLREIHLPSALEEIHERSIVDPDNAALCVFVPPSIPFYKLRDMLREARGDFDSFSPSIAAPHLYPGGQYARQLAVGYAVAYQADHRKGPHHEKYVSYFRAHLESMRRKPFFQEEIRGFIESECSASEN